jgi:hypothetical protein
MSATTAVGVIGQPISRLFPLLLRIGVFVGLHIGVLISVLLLL